MRQTQSELLLLLLPLPLLLLLKSIEIWISFDMDFYEENLIKLLFQPLNWNWNTLKQNLFFFFCFIRRRRFTIGPQLIVEKTEKLTFELSYKFVAFGWVNSFLLIFNSIFIFVEWVIITISKVFTRMVSSLIDTIVLFYDKNKTGQRDNRTHLIIDVISNVYKYFCVILLKYLILRYNVHRNGRRPII